MFFHFPATVLYRFGLFTVLMRKEADVNVLNLSRWELYSLAC